MIKINLDEINNIDYIKSTHKKVVKQIVEEKLKKCILKNGVYQIVKKEKTKDIIEFNEEDKVFIEKLLGVKLTFKNKETIVEYNSDNIEKIAIGRINSVIELYNKILIKEVAIFNDYNENEIISLLNLNEYMEIMFSKYRKIGGKDERERVFYEEINTIDDKIRNKYLSEKLIEAYTSRNKKIFSNKDNLIKMDRFNSRSNKKINKIMKLNEILKVILCYEKLNKEIKIDEDGTWTRHSIISSLDLDVCPYCNRNYITNYTNKSGSKATIADLDHYYSQEKFPILSLNLYNFIPSCGPCNKLFKFKKNFSYYKHLYPYDEGFNKNAWFETDFVKDEITGKYKLDYLLGESEDFIIDIKIKKFVEEEVKEKINNSINTFRLKEIYKEDTKYVSDLIKKMIIYNEDRVEELYREFKELFNSEEDIDSLIFGSVNESKYSNKPLSKLTSDILSELRYNN